MRDAFQPQAQVQALHAPLSAADALALFDKLADNPAIAFGYTKDGCAARAHLMCKQMMKHKLKPQKAWALENMQDERGELHVTMPDGERARWGYHVAPCLPVKMPDGTVADMVFDPGLFDAPVTVRDWRKTMHADRKNTKVLPLDMPPQSNLRCMLYDQGTKDDQRAYITMGQYLNLAAAVPRTLFATGYRREMRELYPDRFPAMGKTWVSVNSDTVPGYFRNLPHARPK